MESQDYSKLENEVNRTVNKDNFADLSGKNASSEYDQAQPAERNLELFLADKIYSGDTVHPINLVPNHALLLGRKIHEQCIANGMLDGFNEFKEILDKNCVRMELGNGILAFLDADGRILGSFEVQELQSVAPQDEITSELAKLEKKNVKTVTAKSLSEVLPGFAPSKAPDLLKHSRTAPKLAPSVFRETQTAPQLLDIKASTGETICAGYVVEFMRYYFGTDWIAKHQMDEDVSAWEIRHLLMGKLDSLPIEQVATVDASMNSLLHQRGDGTFGISLTIEDSENGDQVLYDDDAKNTLDYQAMFNDFWDAAAKSPEMPPGMITFYYHHTKKNAEIAEANLKGNDAHNSHIAVNLGRSKKRLSYGAVPEATEEEKANPEKRVSDILQENFPKAKESLDWMMLQETGGTLSRVYLNGKPLRYIDGDFFVNIDDATVAMATENDVVEWEDVFVADRYHGDNRVKGLAELMMTGEYEIADLINWQKDKVPEAAQEVPPVLPFVTRGVINLKHGQGLEAALVEQGLTGEEIMLHMYAYQRIGLNVNRIRPVDPVPLFTTESLKQEVQRLGGLGAAWAELKVESQMEYQAAHPDEFIYVIRAGSSPDKLCEQIYSHTALQPLGKLSPDDKKIITQIVMAANPHLAFKLNNVGSVKTVSRFNAGETVFLNKELLDAIRVRVQQVRVDNTVSVPSDLPGGVGFAPVNFTNEERGLIESTTKDPYIRQALTLILAKEQKQSQGDATRKLGKEFLDGAAGVVGIQITNSLGKFQIRPTAADFQWWASKHPEFNRMSPGKSGEAFTKLLSEDDVSNALVAEHRLEGIFNNVRGIYDAHDENFSGNDPGCIAFAINSYRSSEANVLLDTYSAWMGDLEVALGTRQPSYVKHEEPSTGLKRVGEGAVRDTVRLARKLKSKVSPGKRGEVIFTERVQAMIAEGRTKGRFQTITDAEMAEGLALIRSDKIGFMRSAFLKKLEDEYEGMSGKRFTLNLSPDLTERADIALPHLNYGLSATRYGTIQKIIEYSQSRSANKTLNSRPT